LIDIRWTPEAADDLERITDYLFDHAGERAEDIVRTIYGAPRELLTFPRRGRLGKKAGTRELVLSGLPYVIVYRLQYQVIEIVRILHGAQRWP
jgi:toxin ParE1/3/4